MNLPDKIIIDLYEVNLVVDKIASILKNLIKFIKCGDVVDVGNDLEYSLREILSFKKKLIDLIVKESKNHQSDILGNIIKDINNYRYIEIMFSEDYKEITSIRLVGKNQDNSYNRYVLFNLENVFDPTVINLLYHSDDIIESVNSVIDNESKYIEFLQNYFTPFPIIHSIPEEKNKCVDKISKKYDDGKPKTFEEISSQTQKFSSIDFKMPIFDARINGFTFVNDLSLVLPTIPELIKKIETAEAAGNPGQVINIIQQNLLDKFKLPDIVDFIFSNLNINLDPFTYLQNLPPVDIITKIDELPKGPKTQIYDFLLDPTGPIKLGKLIIELEEFINSKINLGNLNLDFNLQIKNILGELESINIPELIYQIPDLQIPQEQLIEPNFKFNNPGILNKISNIENIFNGWEGKIGSILDIFNNSSLFKNLPEIPGIKGDILNFKTQLGLAKLELPKLKNLDLNYDIILKLFFDKLKDIKLPDILFNLNKFVTKKTKKKCNVKLPKKKFKYKLSDLFKKFKLKFPDLYLELETKFNLMFPKFEFLNFLKLNINLDFLNFKIPKIELPTFKLPNFDFDIPDLFRDFSLQIDLSILNGISSILSSITKNLLELLNSINKLDDFALENIFPLPVLDIPSGVPKFQAAFNQEWLVYIGYVFQLLIETDKQKTQPQIIKLPENFTKNESIRKKIVSKKNKVPDEPCAPLNNTKISSSLKKRKIKNINIQTIQDVIDSGDVDNLMENIKDFYQAEDSDFFKTRNIEDEIVVDIMRYLAKSLREKPKEQKPKLPMSSKDIIKSTSDMVEQIESVLNQHEINSLLNGSYTEDTAEIVRNIARLNFPNLTYRVDPIKYFRMLGKVIGSANVPKFGSIK